MPINLSSFKKINIQTVVAIVALIVSFFSWQASTQANEYSKLSIQNQFETRFSVSCNYNYNDRTDHKLKVVKVAESFYQIEMPYICSISNLSGKTITLNRLSGLVHQYKDSKYTDQQVRVEITSLTEVNRQNVTSLPLKSFGETNISINSNQQIDVSFAAVLNISSHFSDYLNCNDKSFSDGSSTFCEPKGQSEEVWEKLLETNTINGIEDTYIQFEFETIDKTKKTTSPCFPYQFCM